MELPAVTKASRQYNVLKDHCKKVGRNPAEINVSEQLLVVSATTLPKSAEVEDGAEPEPFTTGHQRARPIS